MAQWATLFIRTKVISFSKLVVLKQLRVYNSFFPFGFHYSQLFADKETFGEA